MYNWSNCDRKSQLSVILTEPSNPRESVPFPITSGIKTDQNTRNEF